MLRQRMTRSITCIVAIALLAWSVPVAAYDTGAEAPPLSPRDRGNTSVAASDAEKGSFQLHLPFELSPYDRRIASPEEVVTVAHAGNAEKGSFQLHLPFELSPHDRWNTLVVAFDDEGSTDGLPPEWGLTVARADDAEGSVYRYDLLLEDIREVAQAQNRVENVNRISSGVIYNAGNRVHRYDLLPEHIRDQILTENMTRIASGVFYDTEGRHLWPVTSEQSIDAKEKSGYGLLSEQPIDIKEKSGYGLLSEQPVIATDPLILNGDECDSC